MFEGREFTCPKCGAPGVVQYGQATYTCVCRLGHYQYGPQPPFTAPAMPDIRCTNCGQPWHPGHSCTTCQATDAVT